MEKPENLETLIGLIELFKKDLEAVVIIKPASEECHEETYEVQNADNRWQEPYGYYPQATRLVPNEPAITEPDMKKRQIALNFLENVHRASGWYSARYIAGAYLASAEVDKEISGWLNILTKEASLPLDKKSGAIKGFENITRVRKAVKDIIKIYDYLKSSKMYFELTGALKDAYHGCEDRESRTELGKALRYTDAGIWLYNSYKDLRDRIKKN